MKHLVLLSLVLLAVAASCGDDAGDARIDGGLDAAVAPDARVDASVRLDATVPDAPGPADAGSAADASVSDAAEPDGPPDAAPSCAACEPSGPCVTATCIDGQCVEVPVLDGTSCGDDTHICVDAACVVGGCGDGYRNPGPVPARESCDDGNLADDDACSSTCTPLLTAIAARAGGSDRPSGGPRAAAAADGRGEVLVVWATKQGPRAFAVMARRYSRAGVARAPALVVAQGFYDGDLLQPTVAGGSTGWVVAFVGLGTSGDDDGTAIALAPVDAAGTVGTRVRANATTLTDQRDPLIARLANGHFVVGWTDRLGVNAESRVLVRRFSPTLAPEGDEIVVGAGAGASDQEPSLATGPGGFAVAWTHQILGQDPVVLARRFSTSGVPLDPAARLVSDVDDQGMPRDGSTPAIAGRADGDYLIAWTTYAADLRGDVRARVVRADALTPSVAVSDRPGAVERLPSIVAQGDGAAVLVHRGSGTSDQLRDLELVYVGVEAPAEVAELDARLSTSARQNGGSIALVPGAIWVVWADDPYLPTQSPATLAYLIPSQELDASP